MVWWDMVGVEGVGSRLQPQLLRVDLVGRAAVLRHVVVPRRDARLVARRPRDRAPRRAREDEADARGVRAEPFRQPLERLGGLVPAREQQTVTDSNGQ